VGVSVALVAAAAALGVSSRAAAFSNLADYGRYPTADPTLLGGGAGRWFTGSPADGYSCEVCHLSPTKYSFPVSYTGLPIDGYVPGEKYDIEMSWPAATAATLQARAQGLKPVSELVAEFVSEEGGKAGSLVFATASQVNPARFRNLWCNAPEGTPDEKLQLGTRIFANDTGRKVREIGVDEETDRCEVGEYDDEEGIARQRRCLVAVDACGAEAAKFSWVAPRDWRGPIWFSAGFVTTYDQSTLPDDNDFVTTIGVPLNAAYAGGTYENVLDSGCSVAAGPAAGSRSSAGVWLMLMFGTAIYLRRVRLRGVLALLFALALLGCSEERRPLITNVGPEISQYEQDDCENCDEVICREGPWLELIEMGMVPMTPSVPAMGVPGLDPMAAAGAGAAGAGAVAPAMSMLPPTGSLGTMTFNFTADMAGNISMFAAKDCGGCPLHYMGVWIENEKGEYIRTLYQPPMNLFYCYLNLHSYQKMGSDCESPKESADVVGMATLRAIEPVSLDWDGMMGNGGFKAPAGMYRLRIEVAIDEQTKLDQADIPFMFGGPAPDMQTIPPAVPHAGVTFSYTPTPLPPTP
jgi:hypothetical protein